MINRLLLGMLLMNAFSTYASDHWDDVRFYELERGKTYSISSGTGFYINDNNIVTNRHVVENCKNIAIRGAVPAHLVSLQYVDEDLDLALLYTETPPPRIPYLRINYEKVKVEDILFSVGYPLKHGDLGTFVIKEARVTKVSDRTDNTNFSNIQFTDNIDHGNSGGPLLDANSNIVGVVTAKITYFDDADRDKVAYSTGMAIGLDGLKEFLRRHNVFYASNSTYDIFVNYKPEKLVKNYVVNIHCVK